MDTDNQINELLPFNNPEHASFFWHEIKRFPTLSRLFVSNLTDNNYGNLPDNLVNPINDLGIFSLGNLTWIDNLLVLLRISNNNFVLDFEELDIEEFIANTMEYLKPLMNRKKITLALETKPDSKIKMNSRYTRQVLVNSLMTLTDCLKDNTEIKLEIIVEGDQLNFKFKVSSADITEPELPDNLFDSKTVYIAQENHWAKHSFDLQTARHIAQNQNGNLVVYKSDAEYIINYSLKPA